MVMTESSFLMSVCILAIWKKRSAGGVRPSLANRFPELRAGASALVY